MQIGTPSLKTNIAPAEIKGNQVQTLSFNSENIYKKKSGFLEASLAFLEAEVFPVSGLFHLSSRSGVSTMRSEFKTCGSPCFVGG